MKAFYLLALIIIFTGCGELENPGQEASNLSNIKIRGQFIPNFSAVKKNDAKTVLNRGVIESVRKPRPVQGINIKSALYESNLPVNMINLDIGFYYVGRYIEDGCLTKMYKKEYEISWLYIHVDCKGNRSKYHKDKYRR